MRIGYLRVIHNKDLYPIDEDMSSSALNEHAQKVWTGVDKSQPRALFWATLKASRLSFFYCILPRICLIGFRYAQPFLLSRTVDFANSPGEPDRIGWALTAAFGLVFVGLAVINGSYCTAPRTPISR
jgi:ATP-binding cassette subfamily C (CFTR/MRP) protein 1